MPFIFAATSAQFTNCVTSATPNTEQQDAYCSGNNGATGASVHAVSFIVGGKSAGLTVISGIGFRLKRWTTTSSTSGNSPTNPVARDPGSSTPTATKFQIGFRAPAVITTGAGGPNYVGAFTCGATGPGGWISPNANSIFHAANTSIDLFSASGTPSLPYEVTIEAQATTDV